ncbi:hypothetical protein Tco_1147390, partial [Tanacetum coccineum]
FSGIQSRSSVTLQLSTEVHGEVSGKMVPGKTALPDVKKRRREEKGAVMRDRNELNEVASYTPRSFARFFSNEAISGKVKFRSFKTGKPTKEKAEVQIPLSSVLEFHSSAMATKLCIPVMLDSNTSSMCLQSWGHLDYARALIDVRANLEFKEEIIIVIPDVEDNEEVLYGFWSC